MARYYKVIDPAKKTALKELYDLSNMHTRAQESSWRNVAKEVFDLDKVKYAYGNTRITGTVVAIKIEDTRGVYLPKDWKVHREVSKQLWGTFVCPRHLKTKANQALWDKLYPKQDQPKPHESELDKILGVDLSMYVFTGGAPQMVVHDGEVYIATGLYDLRNPECFEEFTAGQMKEAGICI